MTSAVKNDIIALNFFDCETLPKYLKGSKSLNSAKVAHPFKVHKFLNYFSFRLEVEDVIHNEALHAIVHSFGSLSHSEPNINGTKHGKYRYILSLMFPLDSLQKYFCVKLFVFLQFLWVIFAVFLAEFSDWPLLAAREFMYSFTEKKFMITV